eukprot:6450496-Lingulodinium_polyedra.AAC.1
MHLNLNLNLENGIWKAEMEPGTWKLEPGNWYLEPGNGTLNLEDRTLNLERRASPRLCNGSS